ncbi:ribbon-helix-helix protein, CopG family [Streptomyces sp. NPDC058657]|uniref:ribbon-helix-helix protein, CopG family n=1 Tax=unclassified Streptomyces TaxID=2593676 RepID=UPI0036632013
MAKTRISISLDQQHAERIKEHAERAGVDVSAYLVHAATRQMAETDAIEEQFAGVDGLIARAEAEAKALEATPEPSSAGMTGSEQQEVEEALALVLGAERAGSNRGRAA